MPYLNPPTSSYPPPQPQQQYALQQPPRSLQGAAFSNGGRTYKLEVVQQPVRARMCGFGDKDRRPITPPPCIRLTVYDEATGKEIDPNEIDAQYFVLTVDLWNSDGNQEVNLVRHSNTSPAVSISAATTTAYPPPAERPVFGIFNPLQLAAYYRTMGDHVSANQLAVQAGLPPPGYAAPPTYQQQSPSAQTSISNGFSQQQPSPSYVQAATIPIHIPTPTAGMFTRNLIGSLAVNAFKLNDDQGKLGLWFVLQDLSVRTEGNFRLKCNFVDVGAHDGSSGVAGSVGSSAAAMVGGAAGQLNTGKAPVLATTYSDTFQVYSAKKFPGVIESTPLSKAFAGQGIKIPIRKDGPKSIANAEEYANDE